MRGGRLAIALAAAWAFVGPAACNGSRLPASLSALHLLYKAIFELSADRGDFVSHLFSRRRR